MHANSAPKVLLAGGPDIDARLDMMRKLSDEFSISAIGTSESLGEKFAADGFDYDAYHLSRSINPFSDLYSFSQLVFLLRRLRPEIVHTFDTKPGVWVRLAARVAGVPIIIGTLPGLGSLYADDSLRTRLIRLVYEKLQALGCWVSDVTVFQNRDDAGQFIAAGVVSP